MPGPDFKYLTVFGVDDVVVVELIIKEVQGPAMAQQLGSEFARLTTEYPVQKVVVDFCACGIWAALHLPRFPGWSRTSEARAAGSSFAAWSRRSARQPPSSSVPMSSDPNIPSRSMQPATRPW